jgi:predicted RNA-binding protein with RPS1 domain
MVTATCLVGAATVLAQEGVKETEQFIKAGGNTAQALADAKLQLQTTLGSYNDLLSTSAKDMKDGYKKLIKNIKEMDEKGSQARTRVSEMESNGKTYFSGRAAAVKKIQDPALRAQAQERLDASQKDFTAVLASLRETRESFEPLRKDLSDHVKYLESDLSPNGTASLKPQAEAAKATATTVFAKGEETLRTANAYFAGLRAR